MQSIPENRSDVEKLVDKGEKRNLVDSEYHRRKRETGDRVKKRREELGSTRADLAKITGISESTISFIEQGRSAPNLETLILLCEGLQMSADHLIGLRDRNYDDVMRDSKTAYIARMFLKFSKRHKDEVLWFKRLSGELLCKTHSK
ncbi:MAG: helix-turn-helix transcriptional regulator [Candidatus Poribacteria bacterium]|nr:helix-turn-helix transcriptional regulator [Candidatus Poribacteria bacterium]